MVVRAPSFLEVISSLLPQNPGKVLLDWESVQLLRDSLCRGARFNWAHVIGFSEWVTKLVVTSLLALGSGPRSGTRCC